ncbi:hypothetical protein HYU90_01315 [Candidatus Collierbacteria bacterium]|nr:hypothetical protein [Candidatus Collierbacteria bacterium]
MIGKIETKRKGEGGQKEIGIKPETARIAETLGKFTKMTAKNGAGDKSGIYGH